MIISPTYPNDRFSGKVVEARGFQQSLMNVFKSQSKTSDENDNDYSTSYTNP